MGYSQGILIPKPILNQLGLSVVADLPVKDNVIEIRCVKRPTCEGLAQDSARLAALNPTVGTHHHRLASCSVSH